MKREIKFRGKSKMSIKEMDELEIPHQNGWVKGHLVGDLIVFDQQIESCEEYIYPRWWAPVEPETVGQFTGLLDKNGVEIYEGDVSLDEYGNLITITWVNEWVMFACLINEEYDNYLKNGVECLDETMFWTFPISEPNRIIVTGNIHDKTETK